MSHDYFKKYSVMVGNGSGCLFQPLTNNYTYIFTAKHLFESEKQSERGETIREEFPNGTTVVIKRQIQNNDIWEEEEIPFQLHKGENYFPHNDADIAILKIFPALEGYDKIFIQESFTSDNEFELCGCPMQFRINDPGERYSTEKIKRFICSGNFSYTAQLFETFNKEIISGMSGGGILKNNSGHISIIGIQSKMATGTDFPAGKIGFVPMKYFNKIIESHKTKLEKLLPPYLISFSFFGEEIFDLKCGIVNKNNSEKLTNILKCKAVEIQNSDITPISIRNYLSAKLLLLHNQNEIELQKRKIWSMWLELLTALNIAKDKRHEINDLPQILKKMRLFYSDINDDFWYVHLKDLCKLDYSGLEENGIVVVASNIKAQDDQEHVLDLGKIPEDISRGIKDRFEFEKLGQRIDISTEYPLEKFKFMNISAFKEGTVNNLNCEFSNEDIHNCVLKIKELYGQLISN